MDLKDSIINFAYSNNIDKIGFCDATPFYNVEAFILKRAKKNYLSGFEPKDINKIIYPSLTMPNVKSIIVIAEAYNKRFEFKNDNKLRANISLSAIGTDYHTIVRNKLKNLADYIKTIVPNFEFQIFVDTGALLDREVAKRANIGWQGKNNFIINDEFGSWIFIGYMLTNIYIPVVQETIDNKCGNCTKCIDACPTGALKPNYEFNSKICISYLTQKKEDLSDKEIRDIKFQLYGCDICQKVCPYNKSVPFKEIIYDIDEAKADIEELLFMSNREFKNKYGKTAAGWRGKKVLQRNAIIVLQNINTKEAKSLMKKWNIKSL